MASAVVPFTQSIDVFVSSTAEWFPRDFPIVLIREIADYFVQCGTSVRCATGSMVNGSDLIAILLFCML